MATLASDLPSPGTDRMALAGKILSGLMVVLLTLDGAMKLVATDLMIRNSPAGILPPDPMLYRTLGVVLLASVLTYAIPRTAFLGAILLTGYLGGAVAIHVRMGDPLFSHTLFGVYLGVAVWAGLYLRNPILRSLVRGA